MTEYGEAVARELLKLAGRSDYVQFTEDGVWTNESDYRLAPVSELESHLWTPASECEGPDAPDPLTTPGLPIPFTAKQLAAFMLHGIGWFVLDRFGGWQHGPDPDALQSLGLRQAKVKDAVLGAFDAFRAAERVVGKFATEKMASVGQLEAKYDAARAAAFERHRVNESGITRDHNSERVTRAYADIKCQLSELRAARDKADADECKWRKAMVRHLLTGAVENKQSLPDDARRLVALRELGGTVKWGRRAGKMQWVFTGIQLLVEKERGEGRKRIDEKTIRLDLREAADGERIRSAEGKKSPWPS